MKQLNLVKMNFFKIKPILIIALFLSVCIYGQVPPAERAALIALYEGTSPELWTNTDNWGTDEPVSNWYGVTVSEGRVTELRLRENRLRGPIPPELWTLTGLTHLDLFRNNLDGTISSEIGNLSNLRVLKIGGNFLNGLIPSELWTLTELTELSFTGISTRRTALHGPIPAELGNLTNLTILSFSYTHSLFREAGLPDEIGQLQNLRRLSLRNSSFSGVIPSVLGTLNSLEHLNFRLNNLSGAIPPEIATLPNLEAFNVSGNRLVLADLEPTFTEFQEKEDFIFDYKPQYVGRVGVARTELVTEGEPTILRVSEEFTQSENNRFQWYTTEGIIEGATEASHTVRESGTYHYRITNTIVTGLTLRSHDIKVRISERAALMAIYNATDGPNWRISDNWGTDAPLSDWYGVSVNSEGRVSALIFPAFIDPLIGFGSGNELSGDLPSEIGFLEDLEFLRLNYNNITSLPESIGGLKKLKQLSLLNNTIEFLSNDGIESLPESIVELENLESLNLSGNKLKFLPENFGELKVTELGLSDNKLGFLPENFGKLKITELDLSRNRLKFLPESFGELKVTRLRLSDNKLEYLPESFVELKVVELYLYGNKLEHLPENIGNMGELETLSLSDNKLEFLPESFGDLKVTRLFLFNNKLEFLPENFGNLELVELELRDNKLTSLPVGLANNLDNFNFIRLADNKFQFDDLEPFSEIFDWKDDYSPQRKVGEEHDREVSLGTSITLSSILGNTSSGVTSYKWFKNGAEINNETGNTLIVNSLQTGVYHYKATNSILPDLTLRSRNIHVRLPAVTFGAITQNKSKEQIQNLLIKDVDLSLINEFHVIMSPNSASAGSDVTITGLKGKSVQVEVINTAFKTFKSETVALRNNTYTLNTAGLSVGMYIVKITNTENNTSITKRLIIK